MIKIWNVNDYSNFPLNKDDWRRRMSEIAALIEESKRRDHKINFVVKAFDMISDCGMLTKETVENLSNKNWCDSRINFGAEIPPCKMNPLGGVLRQKGLTMWDKTNLRYYCPPDELVVPSDIEAANKKALKSESKLAVNCDDVFYYISNDWLSINNARPTKNNFYFWIATATRKACEKFWQQNNTGKILMSVSDLNFIFSSLKNLNDKVANLENQISKLNFQSDGVIKNE